MRLIRRRTGRREVVSVAVVSAGDDATALDATLEALAAQEAPAARLEILVVGPSGLRDRVRDRWPEARFVTRGDDARRPARHLDEVMADAQGTRVAFVRAGVVAAPDWLAAVVAAFDRDVNLGGLVSCAGDGAVAPAWSLLGRPRAQGPVASLTDSPTDVLLAVDDAFVVDRYAWWSIGGFDPRLVPEVAIADASWRLRLGGTRVVLDPSVRVRVPPAPEPAEPGGPGPGDLRWSILAMLDQDLDDESRAALLGPALAAAAADGAAASVRRFERSTWSRNRARRRVQHGRRVGDAVALVHAGVAVDELGELPERIARLVSGRGRVAVVTPDVLGERMAGPAIRAWHLACELAPEHEVRLATTHRGAIEHPDFDVVTVGDAGLRELEAWCDVLVFQGAVMHEHPWLAESTKVLVVDLYDPLHLEVLELTRDREARERMDAARHTVVLLNEQIARGDYFLCASAKQRDLWIGHLSGRGRLNPEVYDRSESLRTLVGIVPFGLPEEAPRHVSPVLRGVVDGIGERDRILLWGGGIYNWFDPLTLLRAVDKLRRRLPDVRLVFLGLRHPNPDVQEMRMAVEAQKLAEDLGLTGTHVFFNEGWVPYEDRQNYLLEADVGVSTHLDHVETEFSFRTRLLDCLWAGLPVVVTKGDSFADLVEARGLGAAVAPGDVDGLERALFELLDDEPRRQAASAAVAAVAPSFRWGTALAPLVEFCRRPERAPDLVHPLQQRMPGLDGRWPRLERYAAMAARVYRHVRSGETDELVRKVRNRLARRREVESG